MSRGQLSLNDRRLRAPRRDGEVLVQPPFSAVGEMLAANQSSRQDCHYDLQGRDLPSLSRQARGELLAAALAYTRGYRDVPPATDARRLLLAGHQPELFHPGVWFKNFALGHIARQQAAVGVNLLIDSDSMRSASIRVPGGTIERPTARTVPLDDPAPAIPFEQRSLVNRGLFASFADRVAAEITPLVEQPLVEQLWPLVNQQAETHGNLGLALAQGRHRLEGQWGLATLELPQSGVCGLDSFHWFVAHLLAQLPRFQTVYNEAVAEYRRLHKIRSQSHPVPDLARDDGWLEAPFWVWQQHDPLRRRLFARQTQGELLLTDRHQLETSLPLTPDAPADDAVQALIELAGRGVKLRTRALTTTLWARLLGGDLFLHGIGGAKYDLLTDALLERFFGLEPPGFLTLSATVLLPIERPQVEPSDLRAVRGQLRELVYHPECHADRNGLVADQSADELDRLVEQKRLAIAMSATPAKARGRCLSIRQANAGMQPWVQSQRERLMEEADALGRQLRANRILGSREYSFCLYAEDTLRGFFTGILR